MIIDPSWCFSWFDFLNLWRQIGLKQDQERFSLGGSWGGRRLSCSGWWNTNNPVRIPPPQEILLSSTLKHSARNTWTCEETHKTDRNTNCYRKLTLICKLLEPCWTWKITVNDIHTSDTVLKYLILTPKRLFGAVYRWWLSTVRGFLPFGAVYRSDLSTIRGYPPFGAV